MNYSIRSATIDDIPHCVRHREQMFRDMGIPAEFEAMATASRSWFGGAIANGTYRGWLATTPDRAVVAGGGLIVIPWPPGPFDMDPRCGFVFNVYTEPAHRKQGLGRRLMEAMHEWCRGEGIERIVLNASTFGQPIYVGVWHLNVENDAGFATRAETAANST